MMKERITGLIVGIIVFIVSIAFSIVIVNIAEELSTAKKITWYCGALVVLISGTVASYNIIYNQPPTKNN